MQRRLLYSVTVTAAQWNASVPFYVCDQRVISRDESDVIFRQVTITSCLWPNIYFYLFSSIAVSCWSITPNHLPLPHGEQSTHIAVSIDYWVPEIIITIRFCKIQLIDFTPTLRINLIFLLQLTSVMPLGERVPKALIPSEYSLPLGPIQDSSQPPSSTFSSS